MPTEATITPAQRAQEHLDEVVERMHELADAADAAEAEEREAAHAAFEESRVAVESAQAELDLALGRERARAAHPAPTPGVPAADQRGRAPGVQVLREETTYRQDSGHFFRDLISARGGDSSARERLVRNNEEYLVLTREALRADPNNRELQTRAGLSQAAGAGGEFIAPLWMIDRYAPLLRAGRAFADQCIGDPLPDLTNSINVPKITTGASTSVSADGALVSNTDLVTTSVTAQVQTISGRTVVDYQDIDLGGPVIEGMVFQDLLADYWRTLDQSLISGTVTNAKGFLNVTGINAITYTDASPTGPELYVPMLQGVGNINKNAFAPVDFTLWHPSTWTWYLSQLDTANRPLALSVEGAAFNNMASFNKAAQGVAGNFAGYPVVVDANVPVNLGASVTESRIGLFNRQTLQTFEGVPRFKVADQTSITNLQYQFVLYGYYGVAFPRQPKMISVISGTGLIVQSGF